MIWFNGSPKDSTTCQCCGGCEECPDSDYPESGWIPQDLSCYCGEVGQTNFGNKPNCCPKTRPAQGTCTDCGGPCLNICQSPECGGDDPCGF